MGGKARSLERLQRAGFPVPPFFVVPPDEVLDSARLTQRCAAIADGGADPRFAVRSSACEEDGAEASFAGMFETYLFVAPQDVADRIERVRACGASDRVRAYRTALGKTGGTVPSAVVQQMVDADTAGVAFGRDPVDGSERVVIAAAYGAGAGVVGGDCDADLYRVAPHGEIVAREIARKTSAHRRAASLEGTALQPTPPDRVDAPALTDAQVLAVAAVVQAIGRAFGAPQDVEWAIAGDGLFALQARPLTTPRGIIWDNSNISESYGGLVLPLTFSFARHAYAGAYRQFLRVLAIPEKTIAAHGETLENMLGLVQGRMYYHLLNWYRLLALVPGFRLNRRFMESMMGVSETLPEETVREIERTGKIRDLMATLHTLVALVRRKIGLHRAIRRFHRRLEHALVPAPALESMDLAALDAEYARLEERLLTNWEAPLVNDFFAMVFYGVLRAISKAWCDDGDGSLHNGLLCAEGGMISTEPASRIEELARLARDGDAFAAAFAAYLERFGDRCESELKLESPTLRDDPGPLWQAIARLAEPARAGAVEGGAARSMREYAEVRVRAALHARPARRALFGFVLTQTRARLRDRENLRFERTRVFGRVRSIMTEIGHRLEAAGDLHEARDIFYVELGEVREAIRNPARRALLRGVVAARRLQYERYASLPAPPDRFTANGCDAPPLVPATEVSADDDVARRGIGCCPGTVRARVRVVSDPKAELERGEILVAERTDPGWILLFPAAAGILVERGSVLSHAAIVSREMGTPSVVAIPGLTRWLRDGDLVEFDGRTGVVRRIERAHAR